MNWYQYSSNSTSAYCIHSAVVRIWGVYYILGLSGHFKRELRNQMIRYGQLVYCNLQHYLVCCFFLCKNLTHLCPYVAQACMVMNLWNTKLTLTLMQTVMDTYASTISMYVYCADLWPHILHFAMRLCCLHMCSITQVLWGSLVGDGHVRFCATRRLIHQWCTTKCNARNSEANSVSACHSCECKCVWCWALRSLAHFLGTHACIAVILHV